MKGLRQIEKINLRELLLEYIELVKETCPEQAHRAMYYLVRLELK